MRNFVRFGYLFVELLSNLLIIASFATLTITADLHVTHKFALFLTETCFLRNIFLEFLSFLDPEF